MMKSSLAEDYGRVMPYLTVRNVREALAFYDAALEAETVHVVPDAGTGGVAHARMIINGAMVMLAGDYPQDYTGVGAPDRQGGPSVTIRLRYDQPDDVDRTIKRAIEAGATLKGEIFDASWGERYARIIDPFGHAWAFGAPLAVS